MQFYGMSYSEVGRLDIGSINELWEAITVLEARDMLNQFKIATYPNLKQEAQEKSHKAIFEMAYPESVKTKKYVTAQDIQKRLARARA